MINGSMKWLLRFEKRISDKDIIRSMICNSNQEFFPYLNSIADSRAFALLSINTWRELSYLLNLTPLQVEQIINNPSYIEFKIPKKKGKPRLICQPNVELMKIQRRLNLYFQAIYEFHIPSCVHGFVSKSNTANRSIVTNAKPHIGKKNILVIDLKDFFTTIRAKRVKELFISWGINNEIATSLALLCTYKGNLPMGAPTSPIVSNLCSYELDMKLMRFCELNQVTYSRYADDLTFSSNGNISDELIQSLIQMIRENGFEINYKKLRRIGSHRKQKITGIIVNEKLSVERKLKKKIRAIEHDIKFNGIAKAAERHFGSSNPVSDAIKNKFQRKINGLKSFRDMVEIKN
jgi:RNA-directed DNA polymerase